MNFLRIKNVKAKAIQRVSVTRGQKLIINKCEYYSFEVQLRQKIMQKNPNNINEAQFLQKMFKYFDIQNKGKVDFDQFYRAMEKTGIVMDRPVSQIKFSIDLKPFSKSYRTFLRSSNTTMRTEMEIWTTKSSPIFSLKAVPTKM